jgi:phospholipase/carboxylesterase
MALSRREFLAAATTVASVAQPFRAAFAQPPQPQMPGPPGDPTPGRARRLGIGDGERDGLLYVPKSYEAGTPMPLLVLLHGAGNTSMSTQYSYTHADDFGFIVLSPDSRDERTWDGILGMWGPDLEFIGQAIKYVKSQCAIVESHIGLGGFSDGGSYALSMGIGNGDVFTKILGMSPGVMQPPAVRGKPKIWVSHGTSDPIMPIDITSRKFVPRLKGLGYDVTYREYEGRHQLPAPIAHEAFAWFAA